VKAVIKTTCPDTNFVAPGYYSFSGIFLPFREGGRVNNKINNYGTGTVKKVVKFL
jgi:hypothetical protein